MSFLCLTCSATKLTNKNLTTTWIDSPDVILKRLHRPIKHTTSIFNIQTGRNRRHQTLNSLSGPRRQTANRSQRIPPEKIKIPMLFHPFRTGLFSRRRRRRNYLLFFVFTM